LVTKPKTKYGLKNFTQVFRSLSPKATRQGYTQIHQKEWNTFKVFETFSTTNSSWSDTKLKREQRKKTTKTKQRLLKDKQEKHKAKEVKL